jgi:hypothetical protein
MTLSPCRTTTSHRLYSGTARRDLVPQIGLYPTEQEAETKLNFLAIVMANNDARNVNEAQRKRKTR